VIAKRVQSPGRIEAKTPNSRARRWGDLGPWREAGDPDVKDDVWRIADRRCSIYAKANLTPGEQVKAARELKLKTEKGLNYRT
jgi:hypothetical protein